jgi:hypothetical protein
MIDGRRPLALTWIKKLREQRLEFPAGLPI